MNPSTKEKIYTKGTLFFLLLIFLLKIYFPASKRPELTLKSDQLLNNLNFLILLGIFVLIYLAIFIIGIVNLIVFILKKVSNKPLFDFSNRNINFGISKEESTKVLFLASLVTFLFNIFSLLSILNFKIRNEALVVYLNLLLQLTIALIILKFIKPQQLNLDFSNLKIKFIFQLYTAMLPLLFMSTLIIMLVFKLLNLKFYPNPAVPFFILINDKFLFNLFFLQIIALAPFVEELLFRGVLYRQLRLKFKFSLSAIISSLFFAILHQSIFSIIPLTIIGIVLCYIYEKTQNLANSIIFHSLYNTINALFILLLKPIIAVS